MPRALTALGWLKEHGFKPRSGGAAPNANGTPAGDVPTCPNHGSAMKPSKHGKGWYCKVKLSDSGQIETLMDAAGYAAHAGS